MSKLSKKLFSSVRIPFDLKGDYRLTDGNLWRTDSGKAVIIASRPLKSKDSPLFLLAVDSVGLRHYIASLTPYGSKPEFSFMYYGEKYILRGGSHKGLSITIDLLSQKVRLSPNKKLSQVIPNAKPVRVQTDLSGSNLKAIRRGSMLMLHRRKK